MNLRARFFIVLASASIIASWNGGTPIFGQTQPAPVATPTAPPVAPKPAVLPPSSTRAGDPAIIASAVGLIKNCVEATPDGRQFMLLNALRQLGDPKLQPLFQALSESEERTLKIQGILGLAETQTDKKFDLLKLADLEDSTVQEDAVSAAMSDKLISDEQAQQMLTWAHMKIGARLAIATRLASSGKLTNKEALADGLKSTLPMQKMLATVLMVQMGDEKATKDLDAFSTSNEPNRDAIRDMLLRIAMRFELDKVGPWAMRMAAEPGLGPRYMRAALQVAMRFNVVGAEELWQQQFKTTTDPVQQTRLALMAMQLIPKLHGGYFDTLAANSDPLIKQIGLVGQASESNKNIAVTVCDLVNMRHTIASGWVLIYCEKFATADDARVIALAMINSMVGAPDTFRAEAIDNAIAAANLLADKHPEAAMAAFRPILQEPKGNFDVQQAILIGLMAVKDDGVTKIVEGLTINQSPRINGMVALLLARHHRRLNDDQFGELGVFVQGGGVNSAVLRVVAAWYYLTLTNQADNAMSQIVGR